MKMPLIAAMVLVPVFAFAGIDVPDVDPLVELVKLVQNFKASGPLVIGASVLTILVQVLKKFAPEFQYKKLMVVGLSVIYSVVAALMTPGMDLVGALVLVLITSGGAIALYEAVLNPSVKLAKRLS